MVVSIDTEKEGLQMNVSSHASAPAQTMTSFNTSYTSNQTVQVRRLA
jgi:hypothetical protein